MPTLRSMRRDIDHCQRQDDHLCRRRRSRVNGYDQHRSSGLYPSLNASARRLWRQRQHRHRRQRQFDRLSRAEHQVRRQGTVGRPYDRDRYRQRRTEQLAGSSTLNGRPRPLSYHHRPASWPSRARPVLISSITGKADILAALKLTASVGAGNATVGAARTTATGTPRQPDPGRLDAEHEWQDHHLQERCRRRRVLRDRHRCQRQRRDRR